MFQDPSLLLRPKRRLEWRSRGNPHPCDLPILDDGTNLCNLSRNVALLSVCISYIQAVLVASHLLVFSGPYLAFPTITPLTPHVWEQMCRFSQWLGIHILIMNSRTKEITTGQVQGPPGPTVR